MSQCNRALPIHGVKRPGTQYPTPQIYTVFYRSCIQMYHSFHKKRVIRIFLPATVREFRQVHGSHPALLTLTPFHPLVISPHFPIPCQSHDDYRSPQNVPAIFQVLRISEDPLCPAVPRNVPDAGDPRICDYFHVGISFGCRYITTPPKTAVSRKVRPFSRIPPGSVKIHGVVKDQVPTRFSDPENNHRPVSGFSTSIYRTTFHLI